ncbi:hypothetical protein L596_013214 [Steinernema carpocapsae]|nr:hypothetical protein L596_013214 [Steinernema carpocapsae]
MAQEEFGGPEKIDFLTIPPWTTGQLQPLDVFFNRQLKAFHRQLTDSLPPEARIRCCGTEKPGVDAQPLGLAAKQPTLPTEMTSPRLNCRRDAFCRTRQEPFQSQAGAMSHLNLLDLIFTLGNVPFLSYDQGICSHHIRRRRSFHVKPKRRGRSKQPERKLSDMYELEDLDLDDFIQFIGIVHGVTDHIDARLQCRLVIKCCEDFLKGEKNTTPMAKLLLFERFKLHSIVADVVNEFVVEDLKAIGFSSLSSQVVKEMIVQNLRLMAE